MKISVVIPVLNGEATLARCLDSLQISELPPDGIEIIVVDNNSTDSTKDIIKRYPVKYVFEPQQGRAIARNRGINTASGELVAFIDADCVAAESWLSNLIAGFTDTDVAVCAGMIQIAGENTAFTRYYEAKGIFTPKYFLSKSERSLPVIATGNAAFRRDVLVKIGCFDSKLLRNEDTDISLRLILEGYRINFIPEAIVYHEIPEGMMPFFSRSFECGKTTSYFFVKYRNLLSNSLPEVVNLFFQRTLESKREFIKLEIIGNAAILLGMIFGRFCAFFVPVPMFDVDKQDWIVLRLNDEVSFIHTGRGERYDLNTSASRIASLLLRHKQIDKIVADIAHEYNLSCEYATKEVMDFISLLSTEGIVHYENKEPVRFAFQVP